MNTTTTTAPGAAAPITNEHPSLGRAWLPVALSGEITARPARVLLLGEPWVVVRMDGTLFAARDRCPHRLAPLSIGAVVDGTLQCKYHGWRYGTDGRCVEVPSAGPDARIPSRAVLDRPFGVREHLGLVWIAPREPVLDLPGLPGWDTPGIDRIFAEPRRTTASAAQLVDNFVDISHFATVHTGTFGTPESAQIAPSDVTRQAWTANTRYTTYYRNTDDPLTATGEHPEIQPHVVEKTAFAPSVVAMCLTFPLTDQVFEILYALQPESATSTRIYKVMTRNDFHGDAGRIKAMLDFEDAVLDEDLFVLESFDRAELNLDARVELHTRADRMSLAYRKLLGRLVELDAGPRSTPSA
ncbi:Methylxanthine N1-demethylase NdmA [Actinomadura rubteroloni]|uniref:Methylxanthine N1-demethylase NdmA n=1 Tax=Actinomadura rubteroloni TaxID=1926885 RepID=A0A2P4UEN0_9ACTN|nr:aromatic ring-hydroxylating dioxygenase subunit alpha [Actinomadura rubteroloni]POM23517.1 Methylxanthine N1-demethylase NdmA [Actinomadura rubteroloni]